MKLGSKITINQINEPKVAWSGVLPWCDGCMFVCTDCVLSCTGSCSDKCTGSQR